MAPKSFYFEFLWLFYWICSKFRGKKTNKNFFFLAKVCQLALKKKATNHTKELLGENGTKPPYLEEKNGFF